MTENRRLRFGAFEFDPSGLQLLKAQRPVKLRPQALRALRMFLSDPGQLITREAIHQELWGADVHVDFEQGVNHTIKQLRAALGDDANAPRYIETVPRLGYRFIAPLDLVSAVGRSTVDAPPGPARAWAGRLPSRWTSLAATAVLVSAGLIFQFLSRAPSAGTPLPATSTLAVLAFEVGNREHEQAYLGVSLAEAVIVRLAMGGAIRVRPVAATRPEDQEPPDVRAVGRTLRADYVLTGTLRRT